MPATFFRRVVSGYRMHRVDERSAALSFHFLLALVPILAMIALIADVLVDAEVLKATFFAYAQETLGAQIASLFVDVFKTLDGARGLLALPVIGVVIILYAVIKLFSFIRIALFEIFAVAKHDSRQRIIRSVTSFVYSALFGVLLISMILTQFAVSIIARGVTEQIARNDQPLLANFMSGFFSFILLFGFFTIAYRIASSGRIRKRAAAAGGLVAATLYIAVTIVLSLVFTYANTESVYGAIAPIVACMLWVYYVSNTLMVGAIVAREASWESMPLPFDPPKVGRG